MSSRLRIQAFAKINPTLKVLGRRPDGYHDLRATFQSIALHDTLTFEPTRGPFEIVCDDPSCPRDRTNLVWRAAARLWRAARRRGSLRGVRVHLVKRIPAAAGLGGGSSDAAATLRALNELWKAGLGSSALHVLAADLGADVPYFLEGGTALGLDRGDRIFPLADWPAAWVVLLLPPFGVRTPDAYTWLDRDRRANPRTRAGGSSSRSSLSAVPGWSLPDGESGNDLEAPVARRHSEIKRLIAGFERAGARYAAMSGSGAAVFGVFVTKSHADSAAMALAAPGQPAIVTRSVSRREYQMRAGRPRRLRSSRSPV